MAGLCGGVEAAGEAVEGLAGLLAGIGEAENLDGEEEADGC